MLLKQNNGQNMFNDMQNIYWKRAEVVDANKKKKPVCRNLQTGDAG